MRLINAETYQLVFYLESPPPYAILSHTWGDQEVTFQDLEKGVPHASELKGFAKIQGCCAQALRDGYRWAWVDTCCIDKTSSTELSEAINSMYQWYKASAVCYVYMEDVMMDGVVVGGGSPPMGARPTSPGAVPGDIRKSFEKLMGGITLASRPSLPRPIPSFARSRWFQRGWTLQELIAPRTILFYDKNWNELGTKSSMVMELRRITRVRIEVLYGASPSTCTVGERMSWAADRQTTRVEDRAYSLLGIFDVNMPLLYGEGQRAFIRLQEEILRRSEDLSLLGWTMHGPHERSVGVLAENPSGFTSVLSTENTPLIEDANIPGGKRQGLTWQDVRAVRSADYSGASTTASLMTEPPVITSRGILVTLLVQHPSALGIHGHDDDLVAWIFLTTHFSESARGGSSDVCFCVTIRPTSPHVHWSDENGPGYFVASRAASGTGRGLICVSPAHLAQFSRKKFYLSYSFALTEARIEWAVNLPGTRSPGPHEVHQNYNALNIHMEPPGRLKIESHHPTRPRLIESSNGRYELRIERASPGREALAQEAGQVSLVCHYYRDRFRPAAYERFVVDFTTFYQGLSRHFHCRIYKYERPPKTGAISEGDSFWGSSMGRVHNLRPVDRSFHVLDSGDMVSAAIKEHVHLIRDDCRFVNVTMSISVAQ